MSCLTCIICIFCIIIQNYINVSIYTILDSIKCVWTISHAKRKALGAFTAAKSGALLRGEKQFGIALDARVSLPDNLLVHPHCGNDVPCLAKKELPFLKVYPSEINRKIYVCTEDGSTGIHLLLEERRKQVNRGEEPVTGYHRLQKILPIVTAINKACIDQWCRKHIMTGPARLQARDYVWTLH